MDLVKELGVMALGSRLKRLVERQNKEISRYYQWLGVDFQPHWFSTLYLLGKRSPMTITGIACALQYTHPAVNKLVGQMSRAGLVRSSEGKKDRRARLISPTRKGRAMIETLSPVWRDISEVMSGVIAESGHDLLGAIDGLEDRLDDRSIYRRLVEHSRPRLLSEIEILDYRPSLKTHFKALNYAWLKKDLQVEPHDEEVLSDPEGKVVKAGGAVLFARCQDDVVGTCALIKHDGGTWELAKLAVAEESRGRFAGTKLVTAAVERARERGAERLCLETNPKDGRAIRFFERLGFIKTDTVRLPARYRRRRLTMELGLSIRPSVRGNRDLLHSEEEDETK